MPNSPPAVKNGMQVADKRVSGMLVRLRLGRGRRVRQQRNTVPRVLEAAAVLLQPAVLAAFALAFWRFGVDLGWTRAFPFAAGPLSHWQLWLALTVVLFAAVLVLNRQVSRSPAAEPSNMNI